MNVKHNLVCIHILILLNGIICKVENQKPVPVEKAVCVLYNPFNSITGLITFEKVRRGVVINGKVTGLSPGAHALHIHEKGDIRDPKCVTVGGHFNPFSKKHGGVGDKVRHVGDLGNINADDNGIAFFSLTDKVIDLEGPASIIGRSLVIHETYDDLGRGKEIESKLTGNPGERLICGVIGYG